MQAPETISIAFTGKLGEKWEHVAQELRSVAADCSQVGWDGYGAKAVVSETVLNAKRLIESLPTGTETPTVGAEPDG